METAIETMINVNIKPTALVLSAIFASFLCHAQADENEEPGETARWFTIEVIVFKTTDQQGLFAESWDKSTRLNPAEKVIDFLQPFEAPVADEEALQSAAQDANTESQQTDQSNPSAVDNLADAAQVSEPEEVPFVPLGEDQMQLNNEASSLSRHPEYQLIFHQAWRQPVLDSSEAPSVRIAGGEDFSDRFDFDGSKKILPLAGEENLLSEPLASDPLASVDSQGNPIFTDAAESNPGSQNEQAQNESSALNSEQENLATEPQLIALPWVPELDGDMQIYLSHYLHIRTNLYLRRPDKEEIEVIDPDMLAQDQFTHFTTMPSSLFSEVPDSLLGAQDNAADPAPSLNLSTTADPLQQDTTNLLQSDKLLTQNNLIVNNKSQFSWEIDDNFLETESEKMYIERLFNYPLMQSRRVRSGELHYFDHPLLGVLVLITPYDPNEKPEQTESILPPSI